MLTKKELDHIADLARLELRPEEKERYRAQLSSILDYVGQLAEVNTQGLLVCAQVSGLENVYREDEARPWPSAEREAALKQAPDRSGREIRVKRILANGR